MDVIAATAVRVSTYRPSSALIRWRTDGHAEIGQLLAAHRAVGGTGPGRRVATQQINHALVVQLAALFQRYCRDLHGLCVQATAVAAPAMLRPILADALTTGRSLDRQNAHSGALGADFGRFGMDFWPTVTALGPRYAARRQRLDELNAWRNAIAHQDFRRVVTDPLLRGTRPDLPTDRIWRRAIAQLAAGMDRVMYVKLCTTNARPPW